jgi:hypothetical protein
MVHLNFEYLREFSKKCNMAYGIIKVLRGICFMKKVSKKSHATVPLIANDNLS